VKHIRQADAQKHVNSPNCIVFEYGQNTNSDIATARIDGRYPEKNFALSTESEMIIYVIDGQGAITTKESEVTLQPGDVVCVDKNEPYFYQGSNLYISMHSTPAWNSQHYREIK
jgi:mannose-6-phosphate isomerase-like protein (cupin superfamily)